MVNNKFGTVLVYRSAWRPSQVLANVLFLFSVAGKWLEENFNMKIRYENSTEEEVMPTLQYTCSSFQQEFWDKLFIVSLSLQKKQEFRWKYFAVNQRVQKKKNKTYYTQIRKLCI
jgi:hypothetical protein